MKKLTNILDAIDNANNVLGKVISSLLFFTMIVVLAEVIMRYFFNNPPVWGFELSMFLFGGAISLGGAYTLLHESHVRMDVLYSRLSIRNKAIMDICTFIFFLIFVVVMIWKTGFVFWRAFINMEITDTYWAPVIWPARLAITVGAVLLLIEGTAKFTRSILIVSGWSRT